jgi:hypothetical protein
MLKKDGSFMDKEQKTSSKTLLLAKLNKYHNGIV